MDRVLVELRDDVATEQVDEFRAGGFEKLGEIDAALLHLPSVAAATSVVKRTGGGIDVLIGYVVPVNDAPERFDHAAAGRLLRKRLPAALVPRLAVLPEFPTRPSGKVDRDALPWPLPGTHADGDEVDADTAWLLDTWGELLGSEVGMDDDFFDLGGTSVAAARLVSVLRERYPEMSVGDLYRHPTPAALRAVLIGTGIADAVNLVVAIAATSAGTINALGWTTVLIYLCGAAGAGYFLTAGKTQQHAA